jgi:hypothetical protein
LHEQIDDLEEFLGKITAAFAFGIRGDAIVSSQLRARIIDLIPEPPRSQKPSRPFVEDVLRVTLLCYMIVRSPAITPFFLEIETFINKMGSIVFAGCNQRWPASPMPA